jgi:hypothetical protein
MADGRLLVAVTFHVDGEQLAELFGDEVRAESVAGMPEEERARTLEAADALLVWNSSPVTSEPTRSRWPSTRSPWG